MNNKIIQCSYCKHQFTRPVTTTTTTTASAAVPATTITKSATNFQDFHCSQCNLLNHIPSTFIHTSPSQRPSLPSSSLPPPSSSRGLRFQYNFNRSNYKSYCLPVRLSEPLANNGKVSTKKMEKLITEKMSSLNCDPSPLECSRQSSNRSPMKRALLIGVSYEKTSYKLKGAINDVKSTKMLLIHSFGYKENNILILTEKEPRENLIPTSRNILEALRWLVMDNKPGDSLVFYYSGHKLRHPDFEYGKLDGFSKGMIPNDFIKEGLILDTAINSHIVRPLGEGVTLHAFFDSSHSGTCLDLPNVYNKNK